MHVLSNPTYITDSLYISYRSKKTLWVLNIRTKSEIYARTGPACTNIYSVKYICFRQNLLVWTTLTWQTRLKEYKEARKGRQVKG
jgi:hypothetical protein